MPGGSTDTMYFLMKRIFRCGGFGRLPWGWGTWNETKYLSREENGTGGRPALPEQRNRVKQTKWRHNVKRNLKFVSSEPPTSLQRLCLALRSMSSRNFRSAVPKVVPGQAYITNQLGTYTVNSGDSSQTHWVTKWGTGGGNLCWTVCVGWLRCTLKFEKHSSRATAKHNPPHRSDTVLSAYQPTCRV